MRGSTRHNAFFAAIRIRPSTSKQDGIDYYNSGGWVDSRLTYLTVDEEGVRIHEFKEHEYDKP